MKQIVLNQPLARGQTADVYTWDANHILKLFYTWFELENIEYEWKMARVYGVCVACGHGNFPPG